MHLFHIFRLLVEGHTCHNGRHIHIYGIRGGYENYEIKSAHKYGKYDIFKCFLPLTNLTTPCFFNLAPRGISRDSENSCLRITSWEPRTLSREILRPSILYRMAHFWNHYWIIAMHQCVRTLHLVKFGLVAFTLFRPTNNIF